MRTYSCGALAAQQLGHFQAYHRAMLDAIWGHPRDVVSDAAALSRSKLIA